MKLNFVCIGAQKAGTTTLHDILVQHPDIYLPPKKEAQFFDVNERYDKGLGYYFSNFFNTYSGEKVIGNINPNLQITIRSLDRIYECFGGNLKIIFMMRNPMRRAYSHYLMSTRRGIEKCSFVDAIGLENSRITNPKAHPTYVTSELGHFESNHFGYISRSHYLPTIEYLYNKFDKSKIKLIIFEDFVKSPKNTINGVIDFLGLDQAQQISFSQKSNIASKTKSQGLNAFVSNRNPIKNFLKLLMPRSLARGLKLFVKKVNSEELSPMNKKLDPAVEVDLYNRYFQDEIDKIEKITSLDLNVWKP